MLHLVILVFISLVIIKIVTIQYINSQMWDMIDDCYIRNLTKNQVCAVFHSPIIPRKYLYLPHGRKFSQHFFTPLEIPSKLRTFPYIFWSSIALHPLLRGGVWIFSGTEQSVFSCQHALLICWQLNPLNFKLLGHVLFLKPRSLCMEVLLWWSICFYGWKDASIHQPSWTRGCPPGFHKERGHWMQRHQISFQWHTVP